MAAQMPSSRRRSKRLRIDLGISKLEGGKQATAAFKVAANSLHGFTAAAADLQQRRHHRHHTPQRPLRLDGRAYDVLVQKQGVHAQR